MKITQISFIMMNRVLRITVISKILRKSNVRNLSGSVANFPKVKVVSDKENLRISFKYGGFPNSVLNVITDEQEKLENVLSRIKQVIAIQRRKEALRRTVMSQYSCSTIDQSEFSGDDPEENLDVYLIREDQLLENNLPSGKAWTPGSYLKIGDCLYEVNVNTPSIVTLALPSTILAECAIRPHIIVEHANVQESSYVWYHSISEDEVEAFKSVRSEDIVKVQDQWWAKVHEGLMYVTSKNDIGRKLRVTCTPKAGERDGEVLSAESTDAVLSGPESFPFEERHLYTKHLTDTDSIRCLSYNILANLYVETKKFPYCSRVARDIYYRKQLLLRELLGYNGDILCLQEVQERMFDYDLMAFLQKTGFDGFYTRKGGRRHEGLACFFRTAKLKVIRQEGVLLNEVIKNKDIFNDLVSKVSGNCKDLGKLLSQDSALQVILLEHADNPKRRVLVANTHLYSNKNMPEVRLLQSAVCVGYIEHILKENDDNDSTALLFCGDFNSLPDSAVLQFLLQGSFECCSSWNKNTTGTSVDTTLRHNLILDTACGFPKYTNYTEEFNGCLDYIFYTKNFFRVDEIVPLPSHESVTQHVGLPSELFPSDHIPIICTLKWK